MDIKLLGIEFEFGKGITISDFFGHVHAKKGTPVVLYKYGRFMYVEDIGGYYAGLLITTKSQRKFIEFAESGGKAKLKPRDVTQGAQIADFNYFLIGKKSGRGIYQYYHGSCSLDTFGAVCHNHYENLKRSKIEAAISKAKASTPTAIRACRNLFSGNLKWNILVRPEAFHDMVADLKRIKTLTVTISTLGLQKTIFSPIANRAKRMTQTFRFPPSTAPVAGLLGEIDALVDLQEIESARLEGDDANGHRQILKLENNPDSFGVFDYDTIASKMDLNPDDFLSSYFMQELIKIADQKKTLFQ
jgi:hypothetical protein